MGSILGTCLANFLQMWSMGFVSLCLKGSITPKPLSPQLNLDQIQNQILCHHSRWCRWNQWWRCPMGVLEQGVTGSTISWWSTRMAPSTTSPSSPLGQSTMWFLPEFEGWKVSSTKAVKSELDQWFQIQIFATLETEWFHTSPFTSPYLWDLYWGIVGKSRDDYENR